MTLTEIQTDGASTVPVVAAGLSLFIQPTLQLPTIAEQRRHNGRHRRAHQVGMIARTLRSIGGAQ